MKIFILSWSLVFNGGLTNQEHREYFSSRLSCQKRLVKLNNSAKHLHTELDRGQCLEAKLDSTH